MKKMRKVLISLLVLALALTFAISLSGCKNEGVKNVSLIVVGEVVDGDGTSLKTYELKTEAKYLVDLLDEIKDTSLNEFDYDASGGFVSEYKYESYSFPVKEGTYTMFYSSLNSEKYSFTEYKVTIDGVEYFSAGKGINEMLLIDGAKYIICCH